MLPLGLFRSRTFSLAVCAGRLVNVVFYGLIFIVSLFLQRHEGLSPLSTGLAFLPVTALIMASDLAAGRAIGRFGTQPAGAASDEVGTQIRLGGVAIPGQPDGGPIRPQDRLRRR